jgi:hypothetical protein
MAIPCGQQEIKPAQASKCERFIHRTIRSCKTNELQSALQGVARGGDDLQGDLTSTPATFRESTFPCRWKGPMLEQKKREQELLIRLKIPCQTFCLHASCAASWERAAADRQRQSPMIRLTFKQLGTSKKYTLAQQAHTLSSIPPRLLLRTNRGMQATCLTYTAPRPLVRSMALEGGADGGGGFCFCGEGRRCGGGRRGGRGNLKAERVLCFVGGSSTPTKNVVRQRCGAWRPGWFIRVVSSNSSVLLRFCKTRNECCPLVPKIEAIPV